MMQLLVAAGALALAYLQACASAQDISIVGTALPAITASSGNDVSAASNPTTTAAGNATTTTSSAQVIHTVYVNQVQNQFVPSSLNASVGDIVKFEFYPLNNSIVRAEYLYPCIPYNLADPNKPGFWSGFKPLVADIGTTNSLDLPAYYIAINKITPIFYYNSAPGICKNYSMVGVINPANSNQLSIQSKAAASATLALSPGEPLPPGITTPSAFTDTVNPTANSIPSHSKNLSGGAIAGIVIGILAALTLIALLAFFLIHKRKATQDRKAHHSADLTSLSVTPASPVSPQSAIAELPTNTIESVFYGQGWRGGGVGGRSGERPDSDDTFLVSPPAAGDGRRDFLEPWPAKHGGSPQVMSELSAYGEIGKHEVPSTPPDKRLPGLPGKVTREGPFELGD